MIFAAPPDARLPVQCSACGALETWAVHPSHFSEPLNEHEGCRVVPRGTMVAVEMRGDSA